MAKKVVRQRNSIDKTTTLVTAVISIAALILSMVFISGVTGNAIGNSVANTSLGAVLFLVGIVFGYWFIKNRKN